MGSASQAFCLLMLVSVSTIILFNSQLTCAEWELWSNPEKNDGGTSRVAPGFFDDGREQVKEVSGEDNVGGELLTKIRVLLGLKSPNSGRSSGVEIKIHGFSPAPAPALSQAPIQPFHKHAYYRSPLPHETHIPSVHHLEGSRDRAKARRVQRTVIAVVVSVVATIILFGALMILVYKRFRRSKKRTRSKGHIPLSATNKVSFDPGPDLFYLNSLAPFIEIDSSLKNSTESKNVLSISNESTVSSSQTGEPMKCGTDNMTCFVEEIHHTEPLSSDDESFHSVCNSHSSTGLLSVLSDENLSHLSAGSPFNSSYRSTSPNNYRPTQFSSISEHQCTSIQDLESLHSSHSLLNPSTIEMSHLPNIGHSSDLQMSLSEIYSPSKNSKSPTAATPSAPLNLEMSTFPMQTTQRSSSSTHPSKSSSNSLPTQSPTLRNGRIPKPPPPPQSPSILGNGDVPKPPPTPQPPSMLSKGNIPKPPPPPQSTSMLSNGIIPKPPPPPQSKSMFSNGNIPKPPPPPFKSPSFQKGINSYQSPPPPPCPLQQSTPVGRDGSPLPKLKPLHWDKVRAAPDRSMVWDKIRSSSFELDEEMIESLFGYNLPSSAKNEEAKNKTSSPGKHVLDHKRLQNITILLKALNATAEQICDALTQGQGLTVQQLEALVKMVPTKEEEEKLSKYKGDISELGPAEQFIKAVLKTPFAFSRVEVMLFKETFEDEVTHLKKSFEMLEEACKELRSSRLFLRLLEAVLKTGNRMNVGTIRGGARAFKLDALLKLADVKGADGKTSLLHFVVQEMIRSEGVSAIEKVMHKGMGKNKPYTTEEKEEDIRLMGLELVSGLSTELLNVKKTASIDLDVLVTCVSNLSSGMEQIKQLVEVDLHSDDSSGSFVLSMKCFLNHAQRIIKELKDDEDQVLLHVREITEYYHGDVSKDEANPLRIFVIVRDFLGMLDRVCKEVRSSKTHPGPNLVIPFH